jgi:transcriptional regulator with XRE-family HTH domain
MLATANGGAQVETLGHFLRRRRRALHPPLSQEDVGRLAGLSGSTISRLENDQAPRPPFETLARVAHYYGVPVLELWTRAGYLAAADADSLRALLGEIAPLTLLAYALDALPLDPIARNLIAQLVRAALERPDALPPTS